MESGARPPIHIDGLGFQQAHTEAAVTFKRLDCLRAEVIAAPPELLEFLFGEDPARPIPVIVDQIMAARYECSADLRAWVADCLRERVGLVLDTTSGPVFLGAPSATQRLFSDEEAATHALTLQECVATVVDQTGCTEECARAALERCGGDIVSAIIAICECGE